MDYQTTNLNSWPAKLVVKVGKILRSDRQYSQAAIDRKNQKEADKRRGQKKLTRRNDDPRRPSEAVNELGEREYSVFSEATTLVESPVEKPKDHTEMMHRLAHYGSFDSLLDAAQPNLRDKLEDPEYFLPENLVSVNVCMSIEDENRIASLPDNVWQLIALFLSPHDAVQLACTNKTLYKKLGKEPFDALQRPENRSYKHKLLQRHDHKLPEHLYCFPCARYHRRTQLGKESLKIDYVSNPIFTCPSVKSSVLPRTRITHGRELPYAYVQLALRSSRHSRHHGIKVEDLSRRWKDKETGWSHRTRYMIHNGRLLLRVVSQVNAPPAKHSTETSWRHLLYDREEYKPFFSVCAHWQDGDLMKICKCALSHVPAPPDPLHKQIRRAPKVSMEAARPNFIVTGCDECRPARRCPECPSEYMVEVHMVEDSSDLAFPFKHALVVTRWTDLGDGSDPSASPEWIAINGLRTDGLNNTEFQSFETVGRRAVGGIFESAISGTVPGQRLISLNPKNKRMGDDGHGWY